MEWKWKRLLHLCLFTCGVVGYLVDERYCRDEYTIRVLKEATDCAFQQVKDVVQFIRTLDQVPTYRQKAGREFMNLLIPSTKDEKPGDRAIREMLNRLGGESKSNEKISFQGLERYSEYIAKQEDFDKFQMKIYCNENFFINDYEPGFAVDMSEEPYDIYTYTTKLRCENDGVQAYARPRFRVNGSGQKKFHDMIIVCPKALQNTLDTISEALESQSYSELVEQQLMYLPDLITPPRGTQDHISAYFKQIDNWFFLPHLIIHEFMHLSVTGSLFHSQTQSQKQLINVNTWRPCREIVTDPGKIVNGHGPELNPDTYAYLVLGMKMIMKGYNIDGEGNISVPTDQGHG